jgi:ankyrin repeat protein
LTALHWAARHGHLSSVHALINAGASLDIQTDYR